MKTACGLVILPAVTPQRRHVRGKRFQDALEESEARFRHMADGSPMLIWVSDQDRKGGAPPQATLPL